MPVLKSTWPDDCPAYLSSPPCYLLLPTLGQCVQEAALCPGPGLLTLDFWVEGHVKQTPAQRRRSCLGSSKEEIQGTVDEVFLIETGSIIALMLQSTMFVSLFRGFLVATMHRGFILGRQVGGKSPREKLSLRSPWEAVLSQQYC